MTATATMMSTTRTIALTGASITPRLSWHARTAGSGEETLRDRPYPEQPRPGVGGQYRSDLALDRRLAAEDLSAPLLQQVALVGRVDVLHGPGVGAGLVTLTRVVDHPLEHPCVGADAL